MKKTTIDLSTCPLLTLADIGELLRSGELAKRCLYHGWIKPVAASGGERGTNLFARKDVDTLVARIMAGEVPPSRRGEAA